MPCTASCTTCPQNAQNVFRCRREHYGADQGCVYGAAGASLFFPPRLTEISQGEPQCALPPSCTLKAVYYYLVLLESNPPPPGHAFARTTPLSSVVQPRPMLCTSSVHNVFGGTRVLKHRNAPQRSAAPQLHVSLPSPFFAPPRSPVSSVPPPPSPPPLAREIKLVVVR